MKKRNIILVTLFAVIGALLIYKWTFNKEDTNKMNIVNDKYDLNDSVLVYKSIDEINDILSNKSGIILLCNGSKRCSYYVKYVNQIVKDNGINEIYYLNITQDRLYNSSKYKKLINYLNDYLYKDDENKIVLFVPALIFVSNGKIIAFNDETSLTRNTNPNEYWTLEKEISFKQLINEYIIKYKEDIL